MRYGSVCSGMEAATCAWHPLGWEPQFFSEIDKTAARFLAGRYPDIPNHGDMTKFQEWPDHAIDLLVGGTPCQSFSVAGLRKGLADPRGNLMLTYLAIVDRYRPRWLVWENVPGVLSSNGGRDFGAFLGGLGQLRYGFAYRVLDAQYVRVDSHPFAVPQRRRRVFVVGHLGDWRRAAAVLLERQGLSRDSPPRREARQDAAADAAPRTGDRRSHWDGVEHPHPTLNQSFNTGAIGYSNQELFSQRGAGLVGEASTGEVSHCLNAGGMGRQDYETETLVTHALRAEGFDASEDGTGRGTPLVPVAFSVKDHGADATMDLSPTLRAMPHDASHANGGGQMAVALPLLEVGKRTGPSSTDDMRAGLGVGEDGDPMYTLQAGARHGVAAYAFQPRIARNGRGDMGDIVNALNAQSGKTGKGDGAPCVAVADTLGVGSNQTSGFESEVVAASMAVRRLTPLECLRLQGFPDDYFDSARLNKPLADGPKYKMIGNSMAVNVMSWIGQRIAQVDAIPATEAAA